MTTMSKKTLTVTLTVDQWKDVRSACWDEIFEMHYCLCGADVPYGLISEKAIVQTNHEPDCAWLAMSQALGFSINTGAREPK